MDGDMTSGDISRALLYFTLPLILSGLLQQCYSIADSLMVGNLIGEKALAAVGVAAPISNVFIFVVTGLVSGYTILLSQLYGAKDYPKAARLTSTFFCFVLACALPVAMLGFTLKGRLLAGLSTPTVLLQPAGEYLAVIFLGTPFVVLYNLYGSLLRGIGDSRTPLYSIVVSTVVNLVLNFVFIRLGWGVRGVAVATVIAQIASSLFLFAYVHRRHPSFRIRLRREAIDLVLFWECLRLGIPRIIQSSLSSVGSLALQNIRNSFGTDVVTAISTAYKIDSLTLLPIINISVAISIFVGQNVGAGDMNRARQGLKHGRRIILLVAVGVTAIVVAFGGTFIKGFGVSDSVAAIGQRFFYFLGLFYPVMGLQSAYSGFLQGNKDVAFTSAAHIISLGVRVALSYALAGLIGPDVIAVSEIFAWCLGALLCYWRYKSNRWLRTEPGFGEAEQAAQ